MRARFTFTRLDGFVLLVDCDGRRSVTNDAEAVISSLAERGIDVRQTRVIYRDSMGIWDELVTAGGEFSDFDRIDLATLPAAVQEAMRE